MYDENGGRVMIALRVVDRLPIGNNTSIIVNGNDIGIRSDMCIFDEKQNKHKVLSVGMTNNMNTTMLLIEGKFVFDKIYF